MSEMPLTDWFNLQVQRAGWYTFKRIKAETGLSHGTVSNLIHGNEFIGPKVQRALVGTFGEPYESIEAMAKAQNEVILARRANARRALARKQAERLIAEQQRVEETLKYGRVVLSGLTSAALHAMLPPDGRRRFLEQEADYRKAGLSEGEIRRVLEHRVQEYLESQRGSSTPTPVGACGSDPDESRPGASLDEGEPGTGAP